MLSVDESNSANTASYIDIKNSTEKDNLSTLDARSHSTMYHNAIERQNNEQNITHEKACSNMFNERRFKANLERTAKEAGRGIGKVLQGKEEKVMKRIINNCHTLTKELQTSPGRIAFEGKPYLSVHPGMEHALQALDRTRQMAREKKHAEKRRIEGRLRQKKKREADYQKLKDCQTSEAKQKYSVTFNYKDSMITFPEYVYLRKKVHEERAKQKGEERTGMTKEFLAEWHRKGTRIRDDIRTPLLRHSYSTAFYIYSLGPTASPSRREILTFT